jgi:hypothetical protein
MNHLRCINDSDTPGGLPIHRQQKRDFLYPLG